MRKERIPSAFAGSDQGFLEVDSRLRLLFTLDERLEVEGRRVAIFQIKFADFFEGGLQVSAHFFDVGLLRVVQVVAIKTENLLVAGIGFELAFGRELAARSVRSAARRRMRRRRSASAGTRVAEAERTRHDG